MQLEMLALNASEASNSHVGPGGNQGKDRHFRCLGRSPKSAWRPGGQAAWESIPAGRRRSKTLLLPASRGRFGTKLAALMDSQQHYLPAAQQLLPIWALVLDPD